MVAPARADDGVGGMFPSLAAHLVKPFLLGAYPLLDLLTLGLRLQPEEGNAVFGSPLLGEEAVSEILLGPGTPSGAQGQAQFPSAHCSCHLLLPDLRQHVCQNLNSCLYKQSNQTLS